MSRVATVLEEIEAADILPARKKLLSYKATVADLEVAHLVPQVAGSVSRPST